MWPYPLRLSAKAPTAIIATSERAEYFRSLVKRFIVSWYYCWLLIETACPDPFCYAVLGQLQSVARCPCKIPYVVFVESYGNLAAPRLSVYLAQGVRKVW